MPSKIQLPPPGPGSGPHRVPSTVRECGSRAAVRGGAGTREKRVLRPSGRAQTCCQVHAHWCTVGAVLCRPDSRPDPQSSPSEDSVPGAQGSQAIQKGGLYGKPGSARRWMHSGDTGAASTCRLQRITQFHRNTQRTVTGARAHQKTRRQTDGQRRTAQHRVDKQKLMPGNAFPATGGGAGARSFPPLGGWALGAALRAGPAPLPPGRSVAESVPRLAGQERSGRRVSQQTAGSASSQT